MTGVSQVAHLRPAALRRARPGQSRRRWRRAASALEDVRTALADATRRPAQGQPRERRTSRSPSTPTTSSSTPPRFSNVIVAYRNGAPVRVKDVGDVDRFRRAEPRIGAWFDDKPAELLLIQRQAGANTVEVVDTIKAMMPQLLRVDPAVGPCRPGVRPLADRSAPRCTTCSSR